MKTTSKLALLAAAITSASAFATFHQATIFTYYQTSAKQVEVGQQINGCRRNGGFIDGQQTAHFSIEYGVPCSTIDIEGDYYNEHELDINYP